MASPGRTQTVSITDSGAPINGHKPIPILAPPPAKSRISNGFSDTNVMPSIALDSPKRSPSPPQKSPLQINTPTLLLPNTLAVPRPRSTSPSRMSPPKEPFNFQSTVLSNSPARASQRRGHRYKHSSVSMNFFQEPPIRAPLPIPASLPIPNARECYQGMSREQSIRLCWCVCHFLVALLVYNCDMPFTALSALAHLLIYDAMCATLCVMVDILGNFDVWKQSSLRHPFGLERVEVLVGFALSIALIFIGGDILSHAIQDMVQSIYSGTGEHIHSHGRSIHHHSGPVDDDHGAMHWASMVFRVALGLVATLVSAIGLGNHSRIGRTTRYDKMVISSLPSIFSNPSHLMTVTFSCGVLIFPLLGPSGYRVVDSILTPLIAISMCYVGWMLAKALGGMLVMSYGGADFTDDIEREIRQDPLVLAVSSISLWQVHHELWLATMKIIMTGNDKDEKAIRERATKAVKQIMGDDGSVRWETTIDIIRQFDGYSVSTGH
jgi:divalent metal cation (Fe/Co/Zn/Cd) transporter